MSNTPRPADDAPLAASDKSTRATRVGETANSLANSEAPAPAKADRCAHLAPYRFKPGEVANPTGRPKGVFRTATLAQLKRAAKGGRTQLEAVIAAQVEKAIRARDTRAAEWLRDTTDGRPSQDRDDAAPVTIIHVGFSRPPWAPADKRIAELPSDKTGSDAADIPDAEIVEPDASNGKGDEPT